MRSTRTLILGLAVCGGACANDGNVGESRGTDGGVGVTSGGATGGTTTVHGTGGQFSTGGTAGSGAGTCDSFCPLVANSGCSSAGSIEACLTGCQASIIGSCASELHAYLACAMAHPVTACTNLGIIYFPECQDQQATYISCEGN